MMIWIRCVSVTKKKRLEMPITVEEPRPIPNNASTPGTKINYKREIAALDFLLGIPLGAEKEIVRSGWLQQHGIEDVQDRNKALTDKEKLETLENLNVQRTNEILSDSRHGTWWEKFVPPPTKTQADASQENQREEGDELLEQPNQIESNTSTTPVPVGIGVVHAPGRRLEGDDAIRIQLPRQIPLALTRQKSIARRAITREWELQVAHGLGSKSVASGSITTSSKTKNTLEQIHPPMLEGRLFFSASGSYPAGVFSCLRYEPKKEEAARRRQKLEARGGGGTQFIMPARDWRGISYRALLPLRNRVRRVTNDEESVINFDRFASSNTATATLKSDNEQKLDDKNEEKSQDGQEEKDFDDDESDEGETYVAGLLDDPDMVLGRHRNVMIGDRTTGAIVSSTIQFVKPKLLKADLNKQFRERFDGWEPPKSQRKYIGARVIDGIYTLIDPGADDNANPSSEQSTSQLGNASIAPRTRQGSISSMSTGGDQKESIRMPPSLTLSKIRSIKRQALLAAVKAKLEIGTVALAIVYFERLCLDCRVDKTNRRLSFAACLLLAMKMNEAHVGLVMTQQEQDEQSKNTATNRLQSFIRPTKKSSNMFASLLEFFTQEWEISLKHLFQAEWGVFAALQFRLHAKPSQVAFHFKRLIKSLDRNPHRYLGSEMYGLWQQALVREEFLRQEREVMRELRQQKEEQKKLLQIQREIDRRDKTNIVDDEVNNDHETDTQAGLKVPAEQAKGTNKAGSSITSSASPRGQRRPTSRLSLGIFNRLGKRSMSTDKLNQQDLLEKREREQHRLPLSPSMPTMSELFSQNESESVSNDQFIINIREGGLDHGDDLRSDEESLASSHSETSVIMI